MNHLQISIQQALRQHLPCDVRRRALIEAPRRSSLLEAQASLRPSCKTGPDWSTITSPARYSAILLSRETSDAPPLGSHHAMPLEAFRHCILGFRWSRFSSWNSVPFSVNISEKDHFSCQESVSFAYPDTRPPESPWKANGRRRGLLGSGKCGDRHHEILVVCSARHGHAAP